MHICKAHGQQCGKGQGRGGPGLGRAGKGGRWGRSVIVPTIKKKEVTSTNPSNIREWR